MKKREELVKSKDYIVTGIQLKLLNLIEDYMKKNDLNRDKLAKQLNVTKGYVSQLLNVSYDHKISKLVDLALSCKSMPLVYFVDLDKYINNDANDIIYDLVPMQRPINVTYKPLGEPTVVANTSIATSNDFENKFSWENNQYISSAA